MMMMMMKQNARIAWQNPSVWPARSCSVAASEYL